MFNIFIQHQFLLFFLAYIISLFVAFSQLHFLLIRDFRDLGTFGIWDIRDLGHPGFGDVPFFPDFYATKNGSDTNEENVVVPKGTYKMYCSREPRFYISVIYNEQYHWTKKKETNFFYEGEDGLPSHDNPSAGYLIRKHVDPTFDHSTNTGDYKSRQGVLYRLAEAYLSYAESLCEYSIDQNTYEANKAEILKYINPIRERAGIPQYGTGADQINPPTDGEEMLKLIKRERRVELNCENGLRWFDLRRWKEAEDVLDGPYYGMNMYAKKDNRDEFYTRVVYQTRKFISYWWPIPQSEIDKNPNLRQLPGWMH